MSDLDFTGKVVLVTGSSRGLGAEMIKAFATHGAKCVINYFSDPQSQNRADAEDVARELEAPLLIDFGMSKGMADEVTENFKIQIPLGRLGDAREIVDAALFLASPMASYITGHVLNVNGGFYMG